MDIEKYILTQQEILDAPRPTVTYKADHDVGIDILQYVDMTGILKAQISKVLKEIS
jgi:ribosome-interacting GTPase 1